MTVTDELLANNERYAQVFHGPLPMAARPHSPVVACMDPRLHGHTDLGVQSGDG